MSKMNFAIALRMTTDQFKRGADVVRKNIRMLQYQVLGMASALGLGGIGLSNMVSRFVDVARETNRARIALRNISGDAQGFSKNMDFLIKSSNRWGQELNGMTSEFAKFSAAASSAGISIADQHTIFESFTRSITAFGMSSEDAHLSYLALSQMMSKGKISSEELRRQLGERMPVAMEAMARAVGVTIQELDGLLKAGKLISKDVMLPFVKEMEKMLPEVNTDNIETSVNRLKNTFTKLTQDLKIGEYFKKIVDWANSMLGNIQTSFMRVVAVIVAAFTSGKIAKAYSSLTQKVIAENKKILDNRIRTEQQLEIARAKRDAAEKRYNDLSVVYSKASDDEKLRSYSRLVSAESSMNKWRLREQAGIKAVETANAAQMVTRWGVAYNSLKKIAISAIATIKVAFSTIIPMAVIGILTDFIMKIVEARKEAKEISNIFSEYKNKINDSGTTEEIEKLKTLHRIVTYRLGTEEQVNAAQKQLLGLLGIEEGKQVDINKKVAERVKMLEAAARVDAAIQSKLDAEAQIKDIGRKYGKADTLRQAISSTKGGIKTGWSFGKEPAAVTDLKRVQQLARVWVDAQKTIDQYAPDGLGGVTGGGGGGGGEKGDESPLQKAEKKYAEEIGKLINQKEAGVIKTEEYNKAIDELNKSIYEEIGGILGAKSTLNDTFLKAKQGVEKPLSTFDELESLNNEYNKGLKELTRKQELGLISEDEYNKELLDLTNSTADKIASFKNITDAEKKYADNLKQIASDLVKDPQKGKRETTFDYKKSKSDILGEEYDLQEEYLEKVKAKYQELRDYGVEAMAAIKAEEDKLTSLGDAIKLSQLKEDIKEMNLSIFEQSIDGVTGFADALDRAARSWSRIANEDMSGFERMIAIINAIGDTVKGLMGTWEAYSALRDLISTKEQAIQAKDNVLNAQKIANISTAATVEQGAALSSLATKSTEVAANTSVAASGAAASVAGIPLVGPIMAVGAVASILALLGGLPKFADGGIFSGLKGGDRNLARLNGGEMIMTTPQQSKLWGAIEKGQFGSGGGEVRFTIEGTKLVGVLNQMKSKRSRI